MYGLDGQSTRNEIIFSGDAWRQGVWRGRNGVGFFLGVRCGVRWRTGLREQRNESVKFLIFVFLKLCR